MAFRNKHGENEAEEAERIDATLRKALERLIESHNSLMGTCAECAWPDSGNLFDEQATEARCAQKFAREALKLKPSEYPDR